MTPCMALSSLLSSAAPSPSSINHSSKSSPPISYDTSLTWSGLPLLSSPTSVLNSSSAYSAIPSFDLLLSICLPFLVDDPPGTSISAHLRQTVTCPNQLFLLASEVSQCPKIKILMGILEFQLCSAFMAKPSEAMSCHIQQLAQWPLPIQVPSSSKYQLIPGWPQFPPN